jgi:raffinose synthase
LQLLEMLSEEYGGRVELAKAYFRGLTESVRRHFGGNGVIASMEHCNDFMLLGTEAVALGRVGDDFWCTDPSGDPNGTFWLQGCHMVHCAYNSLWMGSFIHPDWDMFQSTHPCAAFHAASRAVSGGPVYVSDSVGSHDFALLRRLALPDGTVLRCEHHALPTRDCLFLDPLHDGQTMLKIWNLNKFSGVLGAFNCQGGGWSPEARRNKCASQCSVPVTARAGPADIEWKQGKTHPVAGVEDATQFAVYFVESKKLELLLPDETVEITLQPFNYELLVVAPVSVLRLASGGGAGFAPIGLANMLNSGGAVQSLESSTNGGEVTVKVAVKGAGEMVAYSSARPRLCKVDGEDAEFAYEDGVVTVAVPWTGTSSKLARVEYIY